MPRFQFTISATDGKARTGTIAMQRGEIRMPAFMPVGTAATVKAVKPEGVRAAGADILLGNSLDNGRSSTLGTLLGAGAGALLGREVERGNVRCR